MCYHSLFQSSSGLALATEDSLNLALKSVNMDNTFTAWFQVHYVFPEPSMNSYTYLTKSVSFPREWNRDSPVSASSTCPTALHHHNWQGGYKKLRSVC